MWEISSAPFWHSGLCEREPLILWEQDQRAPEGQLLFPPLNSPLIFDAYGRSFIEGIDFICKNNRIIRTNNSRLPILSKNEYMPLSKTENSAPFRKGEGLLLYTEDQFLINKQVYAQYSYEPSLFSQYHSLSVSKLKRIKQMLYLHHPVRVALLGDSLGEGCNCTQMLHCYPYTPPWYTQFTMELCRRWKTQVEIPQGYNLSKGGMLSEYGVQIASKASELSADLVIIEFGTNDGTFNIDPQIYKNNIRLILEQILDKNPSTEFILCSPILANPDSIQSGLQPAYLSCLLDLSKQYSCSVADFISLHTALLKTGKPYSDFSSNNINHPNDFFTSLMVHILLQLIG